MMDKQTTSKDFIQTTDISQGGIDGWVDGWMDGLTDGWMNRPLSAQNDTTSQQRLRFEEEIPKTTRTISLLARESKSPTIYR